jgi:hypothetical protein
MHFGAVLDEPSREASAESRAAAGDQHSLSGKSVIGEHVRDLGSHLLNVR